jgi:hypothetical protein
MVRKTLETIYTVLSSLGVVFLTCVLVSCICLACIVFILCVFGVLCVYCCSLDAGLLARSQYPEGPATGQLDTGFFLVSLCL